MLSIPASVSCNGRNGIFNLLLYNEKQRRIVVIRENACMNEKRIISQFTMIKGRIQFSKLAILHYIIHEIHTVLQFIPAEFFHNGVGVHFPELIYVTLKIWNILSQIHTPSK